MSNRDDMLALGREARSAARQLALATAERKNAALLAMAAELRSAAAEIGAANGRSEISTTPAATFWTWLTR